MTRKGKEFTRTTKLAAYERSKDIHGVARCQGFFGPGNRRCGMPLRPGHITYDHIIQIEQGGDGSFGNCQVLCELCVKEKDASDSKVRAKSRAIRARHVGATTSKRPMPGGRHSNIKIKMDRTVVDRRTGEPLGRRR